jgi:peptide/nickel transport system substrate-binding protein
VRYGLVGEPTSLNPLFLSGFWRAMISELAYEPLLRLGPDGREIPALATEVPTKKNGGISTDGRHITLHLRHGTVWSDGAPVTSADVKFAVDELLNPANVIASRSGYDKIQAMHLPDSQTIVFDLARPDPSLIAAMSFVVPLPKHLLGTYADLNRVPYNARPVGNGPYTVVEWRRGDVIRLEANSRYWRGRPSIPHIDLKIIPSASTAMLQMKTHEIDLLRALPAQIDLLPTAGISRHQVSSLSWTQIGFHFSTPALADLRVRRAIMLAINREKLAAAFGHGLYTTDRPMLPMFQWAFDPAVSVPRFDAVAASRLLDEAGWKIGPDGSRRKDDHILSFDMVYPAGGDSGVPVTVAADLAQVHIHVDQRSVTPSVLFDTAAAGGILANGKFDLALISLQTNTDPDMSWLYACDQRAPAGYNWWNYCNPRLDADLKAETSTFDISRRTRALSAVQRRLIDDVAFVPLYRNDSLWVGADWLHGLQPSAYDPFWNVYDWTISDASK